MGCNLNLVNGVFARLCFDWENYRIFLIRNRYANIDCIYFGLANSFNTLTYMIAKAVHSECRKMIKHFAIADYRKQSLLVNHGKILRE